MPLLLQTRAILTIPGNTSDTINTPFTGPFCLSVLSLLTFPSNPRRFFQPAMEQGGRLPFSQSGLIWAVERNNKVS